MTAPDRDAVTRRARARRVLLGETTSITVPATLLGHLCDVPAARGVFLTEDATIALPTRIVGRLWAEGDLDVRAALSGAVPEELLDACYTVATAGPRAMCGSGNHLDYGHRPTTQPEGALP
ncbi:hypothetical protein TPA4_73 [Tsukamurella phage TPA4]|uniref:hypothetical protein n=1 Tax=Tsukamurella phage TPA4 TaxID=1647476 RepID=UPI0007B641D0|nr:hypothetical protein BH784_gp73 [Tsukamurella phage TPA4]AKJ72238.1 hypothetical protein TPA4_73 [Tsukamurella phage TPA4]